MNTAYILGVVCGIAAVAFIFGYILNKNKKTAAEYDERQEAVRGRGFKYSYAALVAYLAVYALLDSLEIHWCHTGAGLLLGFLFSVTVFIVYCIYKDAYFTVSDKPGFYVILFAVLAALNIVCGLVLPALKGLERDPLLGIEDINFVVGGFVLMVLANVLVKLKLDKKAEME